MLAALRRYSREERRSVSQVWARRSLRVQRSARRTRGPDDVTVRWRARQDARGQVLREGHTYRATGVVHWLVRRSVRGRVNQVDIVVDGRVWRTCGRRRCDRWLRRAPAGGVSVGSFPGR